MGIKDRREREREKNRLGIIRGAEAVFARTGFHKTTMDAIAAETDWSKGALYLHFKNKEELFFSILIEKLVTLGQLTLDSIKEVNSIEEAVRRLVNLQFDFHQDNLQFFQLFLAEQGKIMQASDEGLRQKLFATQSNFSTQISDHLKQLLPPQSKISAPIIVNSIFGSVNTIMIESLQNKGKISKDGSQDEIINLFLHGVIHEK